MKTSAFAALAASRMSSSVQGLRTTAGARQRAPRGLRGKILRLGSPAERDVAPDVGGQQDRLLADETDDAAHPLHIEELQIDAVQSHLAAIEASERIRRSVHLEFSGAHGGRGASPAHSLDSRV